MPLSRYTIGCEISKKYCLSSQKPKTLASLCWFIVALKGPPLADVRQMALDRLSLQRPQTAHLQQCKVTVAQKLSKSQRQKGEDGWWQQTLKCCSYRKCNRGRRNWSWNRWTSERDDAALLNINSCHTSPCFTAPEIPTDCANPVCLRLSSHSLFCLLLGKNSHESLLAVQ